VRIILAAVGGILGIGGGFIGAAFLSYIVMGALGVSDFEGERAMTSAFAVGPLGSLIGLGLGVWLGLVVARRLRD
jgi:hypothetical protein